MGRVGVWDPREKEKWSDEADESYDLIFRRAAGILGAGGGCSIWSGGSSNNGEWIK